MSRASRFFVMLFFFPLVGFSWLGNPGRTPDAEKAKMKRTYLPIHAPFGEVDGTWARQSLNAMSLEEKVGQLFMVPAYSNGDEKHLQSIDSLVMADQVGGVIFMQGGPVRQRNAVQRFQSNAKIPLMIAQDAEWGIGMRLDSVNDYPYNMTMGAVQNDTLMIETGRVFGRQCRSVGVNINFAPVVDVNNNPDNPGINVRSFGEKADRVARFGRMMMQGMIEEGVMPTAKHFPGKGDTKVDAHEDLPVINHTKGRLAAVELKPFREMIAANVPAIMVSHVYLPAITEEEGVPATLSKDVIEKLLRKEMGFQGLVISDALNMKAVTKKYAPGVLELKALQAGNDILLFARDVRKAKQVILQAIEAGEVSKKKLDQHVLRILMAKEWCGLHNKSANYFVDRDKKSMVSEEVLRRELYESAITLVRNPNGLLPLRDLDRRKIAHVQIGGSPDAAISETIKKYGPVDLFYLQKRSDVVAREPLLRELGSYNTVIVSVLDMKRKARQAFGISGGTRAFLHALNSQGNDLVLNLFGSPYALKYFGNEDAILIGYEADPVAQRAVAAAIFGGLDPKGKLPVSSSMLFPSGTGFSYGKQDGIQFGIPEQEGLDGEKMDKIDSIAEAAIRLGGTPGCAVLVMKGNRIVFDRGYGNMAYGDTSGIDLYDNLYDLASVTKIAATTMATMRLLDEGKIRLDDSVVYYIPQFEHTNKKHITIRNLLKHNAGLRSWIPFYTDTYSNKKTKVADTAIFHEQPDARYCIPVADDMYMCVDYLDSMWLQIKDSRVRDGHRVVYSDLSMIIMGKIIEKVTRTTLDNYVDSVFYKPMGMNNTMFTPAMKGQADRCVPTEKDNYWRHTTTRGFVHDQASAMFGGVSGHAGLFTNAYDLAKILFLLKNGGTYGGKRYLRRKTIANFTVKQDSLSRRGLGFDKPELDTNKVSPCPPMASASTFGHLGFTGIGVWVDPENDFLYIFLSNRTYPKSTNRVLLRENTRPNIMEKVYEAMQSGSSS